MRPALPRTALLCATALLPALALAHGEAGDHAHAGFAAGFAHPFTGIDHLAAMLAVGLWSALHTRRSWTAPLAFAALLLVGATAGATGLLVHVQMAAVEPMIAASLLVLGLLLVARLSLPSTGGALIVGGFALFHGLAHCHELSGAPALSGMAVSSALLLAAGLLIGRSLRHTQLEAGASAAAHRIGVQAPRMAGAAVAALGAALLASGWLA